MFTVGTRGGQKSALQIADVDVTFCGVAHSILSRSQQELIQRSQWNPSFYTPIKPVQAKAKLKAFIMNLLALGCNSFSNLQASSSPLITIFVITEERDFNCNFNSICSFADIVTVKWLSSIDLSKKKDCFRYSIINFWEKKPRSVLKKQNSLIKAA